MLTKLLIYQDKNAKPKGKNEAEGEGEIQNMEDESEFFSSKQLKEDNKKKISGKNRVRFMIHATK